MRLSWLHREELYRASRAMALALWWVTATVPCRAGPWDDFKAKASSWGVMPTLLYDGASASNLSGGAEAGAAYTGAAHLQLLIDGNSVVAGENLTLYADLLNTHGDQPSTLVGNSVVAGENLTLYADLLNTHGDQPSTLVGDIQGVSNIAALADTRIYEAWIQYNWPATSLLVGRYDLNTEFYRLSSSALFLNSSFGIGPEFSQSGPAGASVYPDTALGARLTYKPNSNVVARVAVMDGAPVERPSSLGGLFTSKDGLLIMSELAVLTRPGAQLGPGTAKSMLGRMSSLPHYEDKIAIGGWYDTASFNDLNQMKSDGSPVAHRGSAGAYVLLDARLFEFNSTHINGFLQAGLGDARVNRIGSYLGLGLAIDGLIPSRTSDQLGIAAAIANNGSHFLDAPSLEGRPASNSETTLELTYVCQATTWLAIQPDLQYVWHPGAIPGLKNALAAQVEFETSF